jgi:hypothetical protein
MLSVADIELGSRKMLPSGNVGAPNARVDATLLGEDAGSHNVLILGL